MYPRLYNSFAQQQRYRFLGFVPYTNSTIGKPIGTGVNSFRCDFNHNYRASLSTEWVPAAEAKPNPPLLIQPPAIHHRHVGQIPNYTGHIPGEIFRYGKTYGNDTRDAKRWLRGDFS